MPHRKVLEAENARLALEARRQRKRAEKAEQDLADCRKVLGEQAVREALQRAKRGK